MAAWRSEIGVAVVLLAGCGERGDSQPLRQDPPALVRIRVLDPAGTPVSDARVTVYGRGMGESGYMGTWTAAEGPTVAGGEVLLAFADRGGERAESYGLRVDPARPELARHDLAKWTPRDETVQLSEGFEITGRVEDPSGGDLRKVYVRCWSLAQRSASAKDWSWEWSTGSPWERTQAGPQGEFRFSHVPRGRLGLSATRHKSHGGKRYVATGWADPGTPDVRLKLPATPEAGRIALRVQGADPRRPAFLLPADWRERTPLGIEGVLLSLHVTESKGVRDTSMVTRRFRRVEFDASGRFLLDLTETDDDFTSTLWVPPTSPDSDLSLFVDGIGFTPPDTELRLVPGQPLRVRVDLIDAEAQAGAYVYVASPGQRLPAERKGDEFLVRGLPPGRWRVVAEAETAAGKFLRAAAWADAGSQITLSPR